MKPGGSVNTSQRHTLLYYTLSPSVSGLSTGLEIKFCSCTKWYSFRLQGHLDPSEHDMKVQKVKISKFMLIKTNAGNKCPPVRVRYLISNDLKSALYRRNSTSATLFKSEQPVQIRNREYGVYNWRLYLPVHDSMLSVQDGFPRSGNETLLNRRHVCKTSSTKNPPTFRKIPNQYWTPNTDGKTILATIRRSTVYSPPPTSRITHLNI